MLKKTVALGLVAAFGAMLSAGAASDADAKNGGNQKRLRCKVVAIGEKAGELSMHAKYQAKAKRTRMSVEVEANEGGAIIAGNVATVAVDGVLAGTETFVATDGQLVADLNLDTRPHGDSKPFPAGLTAQKGSEVTVSINTTPPMEFGCELR